MEERAWKLYEPRATIPQQNNGVDCGVFVCQFARAFMTMKSVQSVQQCDMAYYRERMLLELMSY